MEMEMFGALSNAFGPSGFEEEVVRTAASYLKKFELENDAMNTGDYSGFCPHCRCERGTGGLQWPSVSRRRGYSPLVLWRGAAAGIGRAEAGNR